MPPEYLAQNADAPFFACPSIRRRRCGPLAPFAADTSGIGYSRRALRNSRRVISQCAEALFSILWHCWSILGVVTVTGITRRGKARKGVWGFRGKCGKIRRGGEEDGGGGGRRRSAQRMLGQIAPHVADIERCLSDPKEKHSLLETDVTVLVRMACKSLNAPPGM